MTWGLDAMSETARELKTISDILTVRKTTPVPCPDCTGEVTLGILCECPLAWHSEPWCAPFRALPSTTAAVAGLFESLVPSLLRRQRIELLRLLRSRGRTSEPVAHLLDERSEAS